MIPTNLNSKAEAKYKNPPIFPSNTNAITHLCLLVRIRIGVSVANTLYLTICIALLVSVVAAVVAALDTSLLYWCAAAHGVHLPCQRVYGFTVRAGWLGGGGGKRTLFRLRDIVNLFDAGDLTGVADHQRDGALVVDANVTVAHAHHCEAVFASLRWSLERHLGRDHGESVGALVEASNRLGRDNKLALADVGKEDEPAGVVVTGEERGVGEREVGVFLLLGGGAFRLASQESVDVGLIWVLIEEVLGVNGRRSSSGRDNAHLDNELDETRRGNKLFTHDLEEGRFQSDGWEAAAEGHGGLVLRLRKQVLSDTKLLALVLGNRHEVADAPVVFSVFSFNSGDNFGVKVGNLEKRRVAGDDSLDDVLR